MKKGVIFTVIIGHADIHKFVNVAFFINNFNGFFKFF